MSRLHHDPERSDILRRWKAAAVELADVHLGDLDADFVLGLLKKHSPHRRRTGI